MLLYWRASRARRGALIPVILLAGILLLSACSGSGGESPSPTPAPTDVSAEDSLGLVGRPQNRTSIGDVDAVFARYEATRGDMIATFRAQPWFQDGLTREESLFVERSLTFVASYSGPRVAYVDDTTIRDKLFRYEKLSLKSGDIELLLIYERGQDAEREMRLIRYIIPVLEELVGVQYPERVMTVINGSFEINDYNDGQFIRIARCCTVSPFILAHELAHTYWSMASSWFNEGMADIYAVMALDRLNQLAPAGWTRQPADLDDHYRSRKSAVERARLKDIPITRRLASDGLYEVADVFLLDIRRAIGEQAFAATARDIYLASDFGRYNLREKRIEDTFLAHAQPGDQDEVMALFNQVVWGDNGERYRQLQEQEAP